MSFPLILCSQIFKAHYGKALKKDERNENGKFHVFGSSGQVDCHDQTLTKESTIIIGRKGSVGEITYAPEGGWTIDTAYYLELLDKKLCDLRYLYYALKRAKLSQRTITTSIPGLNRDDLYATKIPLPPLEEQKRIAAILDKADAIRRKRQQAIDLTDQLLCSVFLDMFGDPVTNPKGYKNGKIGDLLDSVNYGTSAKAGTKGKYPILRMNNITYEGDWKLIDLKYIDMNEKDLKKYTAESGDILFNRTNSKELVGKTAVFREENPYVFAGYLIRSKVNSLATPEYISGFLNSFYGKMLLRNMCKNIVGMANINAKEYQAINILIPPIEKQKKYASLVERCRNKIAFYRNVQKKSEELFNALTQQAFRGELTKSTK